MSQPHIVVIGAGIAGLTAALELVSAGCSVDVVEKAHTPGGKMRQIEIEGTLIDAGPTVFTMPWVFEELFDACGETLSRHLQIQKVSILARHAWSEHERLDLFADRQQSAEAIGEFSGPDEARRFLQFCERAKQIYQILEKTFIQAPKPNPVSLAGRAGLRGLGDLWQIAPFTPLWQSLGEYFHDPRLRQLFGRYATYCGSSPFQAPSTLMLVAHVEQVGVWLIEGGMHKLASTMAALAQARGARFHYDTEVKQIHIERKRAVAVELDSGERLDATAIVTNADVAALSAGLFGAQATQAAAPIARSARSLSALTWTLLAPAEGFPLLRHNVFFSPDYAAEFADIFQHQRLPRKPTVYVCAQDRGERTEPHNMGPERLLCLVNAPPTGDSHAFDSREIAQCEQQTFGLLSRCGLTIQRQSETERITTPADFHRLFPASGGALYGQASHGWQASFSRPGSHSRIAGLYLAGGSVHPGPGVPMAALSGRLAVASLLQNLGLT